MNKSGTEADTNGQAYVSSNGSFPCKDDLQSRQVCSASRTVVVVGAKKVQEIAGTTEEIPGARSRCPPVRWHPREEVKSRQKKRGNN